MKAILALVLVLLWQLPVVPQSSPQPPDPRAAAGVVADFLGFSETQTAQFLQALDGFQSAMRQVQTQMESRQAQLEQLIRSSQQPSPAAVGQIVLEIHALQTQSEQIITSYHNAFVALLSPDQLHKVELVNQARQLVPSLGAFAAVSLIEPPHN